MNLIRERRDLLFQRFGYSQRGSGSGWRVSR